MPHQSQQTTDPLSQLRDLARRRRLDRPAADLELPEELLAAQESTAVRRGETRSPAGASIIIDPQTGESRSALEPRGVVDETLATLRAHRDKLLNDTLANNPIQELAAPFLNTVAGLASQIDVTDEASALDVLANIGKGSAVGSVLIPEDAAIDPENPMPATQLVSTFLGAGVEGFVGEMGVLRGLNALATARKGTNIGKSAEAALQAFGQGEDLGIGRKIVGGGGLAGVTEVGLQAAALRDPEEILTAAGLVTLGGAAVGGAVASVAYGARRARAAPRALKSFVDEFDEVAEAKGKPRDEAITEERSLFKITAKNSLEESGLGRLGKMYQRAGQAVEEADVARRASDDLPTKRPEDIRLNDDDLESMFDVDTSPTIRERIQGGFEHLVSTFRRSFIFEEGMQKFPSLTDLNELTLADDFRQLQTSFSRAPRNAAREVQDVIAPIREAYDGEEFTGAWKAFERLVFMRDLVETAEKGFPIPFGKSLRMVSEELERLEVAAPKEVLEAADNHRNLTNRIREELVRRGKLSVGAGYDDYVPHRVIEDLARQDAELTGGDVETSYSYFTNRFGRRGKLQEPIRPETKPRLGSKRPLDTRYLDVMYRAVRRFHTDNAIDDFLEDINANFGMSRESLDRTEKAALNRVGRFERDGEQFRLFQPRGPTYFPAKGVDEDSFNALRNAVQRDMDVDIDDLPEVRRILAVGRRKEYILPAEISERLDEFYAGNLFEGTVAEFPLRMTSWWKRNTIWWGLSRFAVFQILGDGINALRSNPKSILQIKDGRLDSPTFRAVREIFKNYGTPMMSSQQAAGSIAGGVGGLTVNEGLSSDDPSTVQRVASVLAGAGLGYAFSTRGVRGSLHTTSDLYDEADKLGAINSGFVFQEEDLARRVLGETASDMPTEARHAWQRSLDTVSTILTGKTRGDPFWFARAPAETIEKFQNERENVLRFASYIQQIEEGIEPPVAAKRAREALVDYGKFTDFENKFIRGFMLPFYSFYRHNIPNWLKAAAGKDVGGKTKVAFAAASGIAAADVITQAWNETFFPEVERSLEDFRRKRFHVILGNPVTGETYSDTEGKPMVVGWEMPYEQALELFGLARPGYVLSQLFGIGGEREDVDLFERGRRTAEEIATLKPIRDFATQLLNPIVKEPVQIALNKDLFFDAPIVPERYVGTKEGRNRFATHIAETFFRQFREAKRTASEVSGKRFDPLTSTFALGMPVTRVDLDRDLQGFLHEQMQAAAEETKRIQAPWKSEIDDIVYGREEFGSVPTEEPQAVLEVIARHAEGAEDRAAAWRYYMNRGARGGLERHWKSLSVDERRRAFNGLPEWARTGLVFYLNNPGASMQEFAAPSGSEAPLGPGGF